MLKLGLSLGQVGWAGTRTNANDASSRQRRDTSTSASSAGALPAHNNTEILVTVFLLSKVGE